MEDLFEAALEADELVEGVHGPGGGEDVAHGSHGVGDDLYGPPAAAQCCGSHTDEEADPGDLVLSFDHGSDKYAE